MKIKEVQIKSELIGIIQMGTVEDFKRTGCMLKPAAFVGHDEVLDHIRGEGVTLGTFGVYRESLVEVEVEVEA